MALILCPECGREISDQAPLCPHCGRPMSPAKPVSAAPQSAQPQPAAPAQAPIYRRQPGTDDYVPVAPRRHTGRNILLALFCTLGLMALMLYLTCPTADDHRREMQRLGEETTKVLVDEAGGGIAGEICELFSDKLVTSYLTDQLQVDNYVVCSIGRLSNPLTHDEPVIVSVGVLNKVYTASPETVAFHLKSALRKNIDKLVGSVKQDVEERVNDVVENVTEKVKQGIGDVANSVIEDITSGIEQELSDDDTTPEADE